ncbi:ectin-like isoform X1 [Crassostrea angulata]|uniref:ectin-like isoform X1 n=1 Tax=Magallana angulata TaxID=2784310 RepID=UPI0022B11C4D|nr:ectin-like isoform X1 [Crassostrea angulata]
MRFLWTYFGVICCVSLSECADAIPCTGHEDCGAVHCPTGYAPYCATILFNQCKCSPSDAWWGLWSPWSQCTVTCGAVSGSRSRIRSCVTRGVTPDYCVGKFSQVETCQASLPHCPQDGQWGHWSAWSSCSKSCGMGTRFRHRECNNPRPAYGGSSCTVGQSTSLQPCSNTCPTPPPTTRTTTMTTTTLQTSGKPCPSCDANLNCVWNQTCADSETCMVRAVLEHGFQFSVHCILSSDCQLMTTYIKSAEIYCCDDRSCLQRYLPGV